MPASSRRRLTKAKSVSPYCTRYSYVWYCAPSRSSGWICHSASTFWTMAGMVRCWKMRLFLRRVVRHSAGTILME